MRLQPRHRQELIAIAALLAGVFIGLTLVPFDLTGPVGRALGRFLWQALGLGAAILPILGIAMGLAGFRRLGSLDLGEVTALFLGLVVLVPYTIALVVGPELPPNYEDASGAQQLIGIVPAALASQVIAMVGMAGAVVVLLIALSALTIITLDWHPFRRLTAVGRYGGTAVEAGAAGEPQEDDREVITPPLKGEKGKGKGEAAAGDRRDLSRFPFPLSRQRESDPLPPLSLLHTPSADASDFSAELDQLGKVLIDTLGTFRVEGKIVGRTTGPVVTQFEVAPAPGVKVGRIAALADDLALAMRAQSIRIVAPIPGKAAVGVEVPNPTARIVTIRELLETPEWERTRAVLPIALGCDLEGQPVIADLAKMPHLLIAGATGSGKSVCINTIITSLIYRYTPRELRMLMIDPKMVELSSYNALPHLRHTVVTNNRESAQVLKWLIHEMDSRYDLFHGTGSKNIYDYNRRLEDGVRGARYAGADDARARNSDLANASATPAHRVPRPPGGEPLPFIVLIVDELADLMMTVQGEVEKPLAILAQKARATGIHLILATQRPSVNVITGLIKANFPSRIAFRVASKVDSRTILDQNGAEALLGNGDMLFVPPGKSEPLRLQGAYISTEETESITEWYRARQLERGAALAAQGLLAPSPEEDILAVVRDLEAAEAADAAGAGEPGATGERDPLFREAAETCIQHQLGSTSLLQRKLRIGYGRAARIIDQLHEAGILGPPDGSKPREVLIGMHQVDEYCK